jgi:phage-related protein
MPNPTPVYSVKYAGTTLPGYAQTEDVPLAMRVSSAGVLGRDGGTASIRGIEFRDINVSMRVLSRLSSGTDLDHLNDCKAQWRSALATCARASGSTNALYIGETDRYINAIFVGSTEPLAARDARAVTYTLTFKGNPPVFLGTTVSGSASISGAGTVTVSIGDTAKTYPVITIPTGITRITLSHSNTGKSFTLSGTHASPIIVDCATLQITQAGSNAVSFLTSSPNFGIYHVGSGTLTLSASNVTGTGTVSVEMTPRYER